MKRPSFFAFLFGKEELRASISDAPKLLNLFMEYGVVYRDFREDGEGGVRFCLSPFSSAAVLTLCEKKKIEIERTGAAGVPRLMYKYRKRWGLAVGALFAIAIIFMSGRCLWDIRVTGNDKVTYTEVVEALAASGFSIGDRLDTLDIDRTETLVLLNSDKISWITINMTGTCAEVQIREAELPNEKEPTRPANIVASRDGQVEYVELFSGSAVVNEGSVVRKGDLLISGVRDSNSDGYSITRASGKVFAITEREFEIEVPFEYEKKSAGKQKNIELYITFFSKEIKIFKRNNPNSVNCDTIDMEEGFRFFGGVRLPFGVRRVVEVSTETEMGRYTDPEAMELAYYKLNREIEDTIPDAQILKKTITSEQREDALVLRCKIRCIENIGQTVEFDFSEIK